MGYLLYKIEIMEKILLLLGTNLGDLEKNIEKAIAELKKNDIHIIKRSRIYRTKPWGRIDQPNFLNMGLVIECNHQPFELLGILKKIETTMGRTRDQLPWGPRLIDLDIIFYGTRTIESTTLTLPHKEFFKRPGAVRILAEIAPDFVPPHSRKNLAAFITGEDNGEFEIYRG